MEQIKVSVPPDRIGQKVIRMITILMLGVNILYPLIKLPILPNQIPIHWDSYGVSDAWGSKWFIFLIPIVSILMYLFLKYLEQRPWEWNTISILKGQSQQEDKIKAGKDLILESRFWMIAIFCYLSIMQTNLSELHNWFLTVLFLGEGFTVLKYLFVSIFKSRKKK